MTTSGFESFVDVFGHLCEIHGDVGLRNVQQFQPFVFDAERPIEVLVGVHQAHSRSFSRVQDMSHADFFQVKCVFCSTSETKQNVLLKELSL